MPNTRISLVIPAYNEEKYVGSCLDHAIRSSASAGGFYEIVVVDNASKDKTSETAASRKGVRVVKEMQKGLTKARQRGLIETKADILAYIDADTRMPQGWLETVQREFERNPGLACLSGPYIYYDSPRWQQFLVKYFYWYLLAMPSYFFTGYMVVGGNFAIRREVLEKMGGFDTTIAFYGEDTNIARRASAYGKVKFKPDFIMYSSARRLASEGFFKIGWLYVTNFLSEAIRKKPTTDQYEDIR